MNPQGDSGDDDQFILAIFPVDQYLGDTALQKAVVGVTSSGDARPADSGTLLSFHPLGIEVLKRKESNMDVYSLLIMFGNLVRTHVVVTNGISRTNPPPEGYLCDSCHTKGWLKEGFQDSKIDGATIPVWLCPKCSRLDPEERDVRF